MLADGANVAVYTPLDSPSLKWRLEPQGNGYYRILNSLSGKALDVQGGTAATGDGANVQQYSWLALITSSGRWKRSNRSRRPIPGGRIPMATDLRTSMSWTTVPTPAGPTPMAAGCRTTWN